MAAIAEPYITPQEYLARERCANTKSEYYNGRIYAMAGASLPHNRITKNITVALDTRLADGPWEPFTSDARLKDVTSGLYTYPDVVVICGEPKMEDDHKNTLTDATVIVEVLSPSTETYDRTDKFGLYGGLESFTDYLLVAQDRRRVEHYTKSPEGGWRYFFYTDEQDVVNLDSIGCVLPLSEMYRRMTFPAQTPLRVVEHGAR